ncbi:MAG: phenylalanine--tRNA ligase subunit beta [Candidatus Blackburnbacteria bacterium]|nr:phenylalanine--tRNA ligase subunit beta [Candidatus Blackburnbacteria bacterium]
MDILIPDNWLRSYLNTKAKPEDLQKYLSLCGPSVERINKGKTGPVYAIEVTTNRVDSASVYGIAREAAAILPRFKIATELQSVQISSIQKLAKKVDYLEAEVDPNLCKRFTCTLFKSVKIAPSPKWMQERLEDVGVRPINNVVDITNYLMHELGQPMHTFDYDKIKGAKMILRASKKGEAVKTLDGKSHSLPGEDIVIEDGSGKLIDLAGIMGGEASAIDENTQNVLLFVQHYNPLAIRRTSMKLAHRTEAAALFERDLDPENVEPTIRRGIDLLKELAQGEPENKILDIYPQPPKEKKVEVSTDFINTRLGVNIPQKEVVSILSSLGFKVGGQNNMLTISVPSYRANDVSIPEDIVEEVARIYGYHNLPSQIMSGALPQPLINSPFEFEQKAKQTLRALGGIEVYTLSLIARDKTHTNSLKLKNPLGADSEYLRQSLVPSLKHVINENRREKEPYHIFEMANVYLPKKGDLPQEKMMLVGMFSQDFPYRKVKGVVEALVKELRVQSLPKLQHLAEGGLWYYELEMETLQKEVAVAPSYQPIPKYPSQVEDVTLVLPAKTLLGEVIEEIRKTDKQVGGVDLIDTYQDAKTIRIAYRNPEKTLTDAEVAGIRGKVLAKLAKEFGARIKE